jgi:DNA invertase Pin-like site-specific DNA recombinase
MEAVQKDAPLAHWTTAQLIARLTVDFGCVTSDVGKTPAFLTANNANQVSAARRNPTSQIRHRMMEKKKLGRPKGTTSPILEHNTALILELHRRQVDNTNIARIVGVTPPTVAAFIKRKSVQATP